MISFRSIFENERLSAEHERFARSQETRAERHRMASKAYSNRAYEKMKKGDAKGARADNQKSNAHHNLVLHHMTAAHQVRSRGKHGYKSGRSTASNARKVRNRTLSYKGPTV